MAQMELEIYSPKSDNEFLQAIDFNYMELKTAINKSIKKYKGLTYTEDTIKTAKEDRAKLNKFKNALDDKRKDVKNLCLKPYQNFDTRIKELISLIEKPVLEIDCQIKTFEEKRKMEKKAILEEFFDDDIDDLKDLVSFEKIFNPRWLNATFSTQNAFMEIDAHVQKIRKDLETIEALKTDCEAELKSIYFRSLNLGDALKENEIRKQEKAKVEERERLKAQKEVEQKQIGLASGQPQLEQMTQPEQEPLHNEDSEELHEVKFKVTATIQQFQLLKQFFLENNITFGRIY